VPQDESALVEYLSAIIEEGRQVAAVQVNATLTITYWLVGRAVSINMLRDGRADYGKQIRQTVSDEMAARFGRGYSRPNLITMVAFARQVPDYNGVCDLAQRPSLHD